MTSDDLRGWMVLLEIDGQVCQTLEQAKEAAIALGWQLEDEDAQVAPDAEAGLWMVTLDEDDFRELAAQHGLSKTVLNDNRAFHGEVDLP